MTNKVKRSLIMEVRLVPREGKALQSCSQVRDLKSRLLRLNERDTCRNELLRGGVRY